MIFLATFFILNSILVLSINLWILAEIVTLLPSSKILVVIFRSNSHSQMGNPIPFPRTYHTSHSASQKATSGQKGGPKVYSHGAPWCKSKSLLIAHRKRRKRISSHRFVFLLFLLSFVFAGILLSRRGKQLGIAWIGQGTFHSILVIYI